MINLKTIVVTICEACLAGEGSECHTPGCALFLHRVDLPIHPELYTNVAALQKAKGEVARLCELLSEAETRHRAERLKFDAQREQWERVSRGLADVPTAPPSLAPATPAGAEGDCFAGVTQTDHGLGVVDVGDIHFDGKHGVLISPRAQHIPVGEVTGENLQYEAKPGDVVLWIHNEDGANVLRKVIDTVSPPASPRGWWSGSRPRGKSWSITPSISARRTKCRDCLSLRHSTTPRR